LINGFTYKLTDACSATGLSGDDCCWTFEQKTVCTNTEDTCGAYRNNPDCIHTGTICIEKEHITGKCLKFQSEFKCVSGYSYKEVRVCTNMVCADADPGTAAKCFNPGEYESGNMRNMANAIATIQMGQTMAQDMNCSDPKNPRSCTLFTGRYFTCKLYAPDFAQPGGFNNAGNDCGLDQTFFINANVPVGYAASDRSLYSQATSGTNNVLGNPLNFSLSNDDAKAVNNSVDLNNDSKGTITNQDQKINYDGNHSRNPNIGLNNGRVVSTSINKEAVKDIGGFLSFKSYLSDTSVNLAWNRMKSEPNPNAVRFTKFSDLKITRKPPNTAFGWHSEGWGGNYPIINGLCVHFADYCEGGDNDATSSDFIKGTFSAIGGWTNNNFCAKCSLYASSSNKCLAAEPKQVFQQWCCFNSKIALDINLAAYDQGLLNIYTGKDRHSDQIYHSNTCGGITVEQISKIDFSKGNYFKDLMDSIDVNQIIDTSNFTNPNIRGNTQNRASDTAASLIGDWKNRPH